MKLMNNVYKRKFLDVCLSLCSYYANAIILHSKTSSENKQMLMEAERMQHSIS